MMKPVFGEDGLATVAGNLRVFYFDQITHEYTGWSDEYIHEGVSMPGYSTDIDPGVDVAGKVSVFESGKWILKEDHRGEVVYSTTDGMPCVVDFIGIIDEGYTSTAPFTQYDKWDGEKWVTDVTAEHEANVAAATAEKQARISQANEYMNSKQWPGKAAMGRLKDAEKAQYNTWLDYLDALEAVDTSSAPDINWPVAPQQ